MANTDTVSFEELVSALKQMYEEIGSISYYLFAIKYGKYLENQNLTEIVRSANLTENLLEVRQIHFAVHSFCLRT